MPSCGPPGVVVIGALPLQFVDFREESVEEGNRTRKPGSSTPGSAAHSARNREAGLARDATNAGPTASRMEAANVATATTTMTQTVTTVTGRTPRLRAKTPQTPRPTAIPTGMPITMPISGDGRRLPIDGEGHLSADEP